MIVIKLDYKSRNKVHKWVQRFIFLCSHYYWKHQLSKLKQLDVILLFTDIPMIVVRFAVFIVCIYLKNDCSFWYYFPLEYRYAENNLKYFIILHT
jgi:hypothetical protein